MNTEDLIFIWVGERAGSSLFRIYNAKDYLTRANRVLLGTAQMDKQTNSMKVTWEKKFLKSVTPLTYPEL